MMPRTKKKQSTSAARQAVSLAEPFQVNPTHEAIATRAYELFRLRGGDHGRDWEDWLLAERELCSEKFDSV